MSLLPVTLLGGRRLVRSPDERLRLFALTDLLGRDVALVEAGAIYAS
jgi:hypothetical protein